ncbi:hypothetical protein P3T76_007372 [Phytophthora citrophthora]|uniref:Uncharacterized protein n=1 Tax=Phytophthora citrophthora TaxID=4793 RepID=A0AAD9GP73_9STRA|nr:hypothetical protein P3T76_007372 [Phytophthora citrophthora]
MDEEDEELELAVQKSLCTKRFEALGDLRNTYLSTTQLTTSNVISTVVTALAVRNIRRKRSKLLTPPSNQEHREMVYGAPKSLSARSNKIRKGSIHQAQLPTFRRSLPSLSIPTSRLHRELLLERDVFMAQLTKEREEKAQLEDWAATRIQACYRGFISRPRAVAYARRMNKLALRSVSSIRLDLADMQENLRLRGNIPEDEANKDTAMWRQGVKARSRRKRNIKNRHEERHLAVIRIQACVRRFLAKIAYRHLVIRARDERLRVAAVKIQSIYRGCYLRSWIHKLVPKLRYNAAVQIQSLVRQARERVAMLRFERTCEERRSIGLAFPFKWGNRAHGNLSNLTSDTPRSSLRVLYENRKSRASLEFKTGKWKEQRSFLRVYNVSQKLVARRARLVHRWNWTKSVVLDKRRQRRVKRIVSAFSSLPSAGRAKSASRTTQRRQSKIVSPAKSPQH